jgi:hypothetical protein
MAVNFYRLHTFLLILTDFIAIKSGFYSFTAVKTIKIFIFYGCNYTNFIAIKSGLYGFKVVKTIKIFLGL